MNKKNTFFFKNITIDIVSWPYHSTVSFWYGYIPTNELLELELHPIKML